MLIVSTNFQGFNRGGWLGGEKGGTERLTGRAQNGADGN